LAIICREHKLLFVMVPGTGCSTVGNILLDRFGGEWLPSETVYKNGERVVPRKHCSIAEMRAHGVVSDDELRGLFKFATIRNPFDRFVTGYQRAAGSWLTERLEDPDSHFNQGPQEAVEKRRRKALTRVERTRTLGFEQWLLQGLNLEPSANPIRIAQRVRRRLAPKARRDTLFPMIDGVDYLMRYETLEKDLNEVLGRAGITEHVSLARPRTSTDRTPGKRPYQDYYTPELRRTIERAFSRELAEYGYAFP